MIALFLTDPCAQVGNLGEPAHAPCAVFDHWEDQPNGFCAGKTADGHYVVQLETRGAFHFDADNPTGWQQMIRSGQGVVTQHGETARFAYYWLNWQ